MSSQNRDQQGHNIHFFKVILESTIRDGKLMIPRSFVKQYGEELSNPVILMVPNGAKWEVHWTKRESDFWFQKGWEKFAQHYSLSHGHFLVFRYEGGFQFQVLIFNEGALEIDYPPSISSTYDGEGTNISHEDAEISDDDSSLPSRHKKMKTNAWPRRGGSVNPKNWSKTKSNRRKNEAHEHIEGSKALERAKNFNSDYPFFIRTMHPSYLQNLLLVPACFAKRHMFGLKGTATIVVSEDMEKTWLVKFKFNASANRAMINNGWILIVQEYNLKEGDVCVFEMIGSHGTNVSFKITIFQDTDEEPSSEQCQANRFHQEKQRREPIQIGERSF